MRASWRVCKMAYEHHCSGQVRVLWEFGGVCGRHCSHRPSRVTCRPPGSWDLESAIRLLISFPIDRLRLFCLQEEAVTFTRSWNCHDLVVLEAYMFMLAPFVDTWKKIRFFIEEISHVTERYKRQHPFIGKTAQIQWCVNQNENRCRTDEKVPAGNSKPN